MPDINEHEQIRWAANKRMRMCDGYAPMWGQLFHGRADCSDLLELLYALHRPDRLFVLTFSGAASEQCG